MTTTLITPEGTPGIGTYLIGGVGMRSMGPFRYDQSCSRRTTTLITPEGTQEPDYPLKYYTREACATPDPDTYKVMVTDGWSLLYVQFIVCKQQKVRVHYQYTLFIFHISFL